jgi:hypothetical protein
MSGSSSKTKAQDEQETGMSMMAPGSNGSLPVLRWLQTSPITAWSGHVEWQMGHSIRFEARIQCSTPATTDGCPCCMVSPLTCRTEWPNQRLFGGLIQAGPARHDRSPGFPGHLRIMIAGAGRHAQVSRARTESNQKPPLSDLAPGQR